MAANDSFSEIGVTGLKMQGGYVNEEFLTQLRGSRGMRVYREMASNDATVGALLFAIDLLIRSTEWSVEAADDTPEGEDARAFVESLMGDMSHTWEDAISEAMTMVIYGWSYLEHVFKRRVGPLERDASKRSRYTDGLIGIRKLAPRAQNSLLSWDLQEDGGISGWTQLPTDSSQWGQRYLPLSKGLLFRTRSHLNNPEGESVLRRAYTSWYRLKQIQGYEAVGIERELAGLPVLYLPSATLNDTTAAGLAALDEYRKVVRDIRINDQAGVILPSDPYKDGDNNPTSQAKCKLELLSSGGQRAIDPDKTIRRYQADIARSVLADFLMLGSDGKGSYALSDNKTSLFLTAIETFNGVIASVLNRHLLPRLWVANSFDRDTMPVFRPGTVAPTDLEALGNYIQQLAGAGFMLGTDENLEDHLRSEAGLPAAERGASEPSSL